jgi:transcription elongation factor Elf1
MTCTRCREVKSVSCVCGKTLYDRTGIKYQMNKSGDVRCLKCGREYNIKSIIACKENDINLDERHVTRKI